VAPNPVAVAPAATKIPPIAVLPAVMAPDREAPANTAVPAPAVNTQAAAIATTPTPAAIPFNIFPNKPDDFFLK
jgi:hypothetical protein